MPFVIKICKEYIVDLHILQKVRPYFLFGHTAEDIQINSKKGEATRHHVLKSRSSNQQMCAYLRMRTWIRDFVQLHDTWRNKHSFWFYNLLRSFSFGLLIISRVGSLLICKHTTTYFITELIADLMGCVFKRMCNLPSSIKQTINLISMINYLIASLV